MGILEVLLEFVVQSLTPAGMAIFGLIIAIIIICFQLQRAKSLKENYEDRLTIAKERLALAKEAQAGAEQRVEKPLKPVEADDTALQPVAPENEALPEEKPAIKWNYQTVALLEPETPDELEPKTPDQWRQELWNALNARDIEQLEEPFKKLQELEQNDDQKLKNKEAYLHLRYICGDTSALAELYNLAEQSEVSNAHFWIAQCYEYSDDFEKAAKEYEMSLQGTKTEKERASVTVSIAECLFKAEKQQKAYARVMQEIGEVTDREARYTLYKGLASLYELAKKPDLRALALEKALEITPNDTQSLFDVAYSYGQEELDTLALLHYKTLLDFEPDRTAALNNIGVKYEQLQMPMYAVESYRKAAELGNTLAAANLAYQFMDAGFAEEASKTLDEAKQKPKLHPRVGSAITALSEKKEKEWETKKAFLNAAREQQRFLRSFGEAYFIEKPDCPSFDDIWLFSDGIETTITQTNHIIGAEWDSYPEKHTLIGYANNRAATIIIRTETERLPDVFAESESSSRGYAFLSPDGQQLHIMILKGTEHSFMTLERAQYEGDF